VDGKCDDHEAERLDHWWDALSDAQRRQAFSLAPHNPMPTWMVASLQKAEVSGLVARPGEPEYMPAWIAMPEHVARLVARHRRGGTYQFQHSTRKSR
jgi:glutamate/tyrosine decarboxylase-like PLP-dependent enzyme